MQRAALPRAAKSSRNRQRAHPHARDTRTAGPTWLPAGALVLAQALARPEEQVSGALGKQGGSQGGVGVPSPAALLRPPLQASVEGGRTAGVFPKGRDGILHPWGAAPLAAPAHLAQEQAGGCGHDVLHVVVDARQLAAVKQRLQWCRGVSTAGGTPGPGSAHSTREGSKGVRAVRVLYACALQRDSNCTGQEGCAPARGLHPRGVPTVYACFRDASSSTSARALALSDSNAWRTRNMRVRAARYVTCAAAGDGRRQRQGRRRGLVSSAGGEQHGHAMQQRGAGPLRALASSHTGQREECGLQSTAGRFAGRRPPATHAPQ